LTLVAAFIAAGELTEAEALDQRKVAAAVTKLLARPEIVEVVLTTLACREL
jgi:hypothetical protein